PYVNRRLMGTTWVARGPGRGGGEHAAGVRTIALLFTSPHHDTLDVAYVSTMAPLAGSIVGGLTSSGTTWLSQLAQARAGEMAHEMKLREDLYREFIIAASKAYGDALLNSEPHIPELVSLYAMISRM